VLQGPLRSTSARRLILAAAVGGCVLRLAFGLVYWNARPLTHDEREYLALAANISAGRGFVYDPSVESGTGQQFGRAPGYPLFLAAIGAGRTDAEATPLVVKIAQAIVGAAGVWLIGLLALRSGGERAGITAAGIAAVYPSLVSMPSYVLSETLYSTMALGCAMMLQDGLLSATGTRPEIGRTVSAGLLAGAGALVRPAMLLFLPIAAVWLFATRRHRLAIAFVLAGLLPIVPWTFRNIRVYDRFVLIASEGGVTFWTGNHPLAVGEGDLAANPEIKQAEIEFRRAHAGLAPEALEPLYYRDALTYITAHPVWWMSLLARKAFYLAVPIGPSYALHSTRYRAASAVPYLLLLPFAIAGARRLVRAQQPPAALFLLAGSAVLMCLIFFPQERFRIPVIDPTLIVCASGLAGRTRL
jgi:4-amino-4-deoxy-L-arabinose transferase-like glycosyltransferase